MPLAAAAQAVTYAWKAITYRLPEQPSRHRSPDRAQGPRPIVTRWHCLLNVETPNGRQEVARGYVDFPATDHTVIATMVESQAAEIYPGPTYWCHATPVRG